jgi:hypothetical protein
MRKKTTVKVRLIEGLKDQYNNFSGPARNQKGEVDDGGNASSSRDSSQK